MTDATVAERTEEQTAKDEKQAEADFARGYAKVKGGASPEAKADTETDETTTTTDTTGKDSVDGAAPEGEKPAGADTVEGGKTDAAAATAAAAAPAKDPWEGVPPVVRQKLESMETNSAQRLRNIEGHIGGLTSKLDSALATAKAAATKAGGEAPTDTQVTAALADPEAWKKLKEDFPDWAGPIEAQFTALRGEIAKVAKPAVDTDGLKKQIGESLRTEILNEVRSEFIADKYPTWQQTVKSADFQEWRKAQSAEVNALGASDKPKDAIRMLDLFEDHKKQLAQAAADRAKKDRRLAAAGTPAGTGAAPASTGISDDEAFARGYKRVAKARTG